MQALAQVGDREGALAVAEKIGDKFQKAKALSGVAELLHASGDLEISVEVFRRALKSARLAGNEAVLACLETGAVLLADLGSRKTLRQVVERMIEIDCW